MHKVSRIRLFLRKMEIKKETKDILFAKNVQIVSCFMWNVKMRLV